MPKPNKNESHDDFISRCMSDSEAKSDYPDEKQRYAVCESFWENRKKSINYAVLFPKHRG